MPYSCAGASLKPLLGLLPILALSHSLAYAEAVDCHVNYGGETQVISATPTAAPYEVAPIAIGSLFLFRMVVQRTPPGLGAVKVYTYVDRDPPQGATLVHQAEYLYPPLTSAAKHSRYGFTGLQRVYEPLRDGELQYWCVWKK